MSPAIVVVGSVILAILAIIGMILLTTHGMKFSLWLFEHISRTTRCDAMTKEFFSREECEAECLQCGDEYYCTKIDTKWVCRAK